MRTSSGEIPGNNRNALTTGAAISLTFNVLPLTLRTREKSISISIPTVPSGGKFGESNAANPSALTFVDRHPRSSFPPKYKHTSGMSYDAASISEVMRFSRASLRISHSGICEPVMMTGLRRPPRRKGRADAV